MMGLPLVTGIAADLPTAGGAPPYQPRYLGFTADISNYIELRPQNSFSI